MVSIIVPIYNTEKYIRRCLNSILNQTISDWEAILVNDGSSDGSEEICKEFAEIDKRFVLISQTNHGVAHARNAGLERAKGEYITFVDSDDYVSEEYLKSFLDNLADNDMSVCGYQWVDEKNDTVLKNSEMNTKVVCKKEVFLNALFNDKFDYQGYLVNKLFKTEILREYNIRFDEDIYYNEDRLFVCKYVMNCKSVAIFPDHLYCYVQREDSAMGKVKNVFGAKAFTELVAFERMAELLIYEHHSIALQCEYELVWKVLHVLRKLQMELEEDKIQQLHTYRKRYVKECMCSRHITLKKKIRLLVVNMLYYDKSVA